MMTTLVEIRHTLDRAPVEVSDVASAANWLDMKYPGWAEKIDLDDFDVEQSWTCIGAYIGADWWSELTVGWQKHSGSDNDDVFADHTEEWRQEILARTT